MVQVNQKVLFKYRSEPTSADLNKITAVSVPSGRSIINGFEIIKLSNTTIRVTKGLAVKEFCIIEYFDDVEFNVDVSIDCFLYVVLTYNYIDSENAPDSLLQIKKESEVSLESDLILGFLEINNHIIANVYDVHPHDPSKAREVDTISDTKIADHNIDPEAHQDIRVSINDAIEKNIVTKLAGETINSYAAVCLINGKVYTANNLPYDAARNNVIGIALNGGGIDSEIRIQTNGVIANANWSFTNNNESYIYLRAMGSVNDQIPTVANEAVIIVGTKIDSSSLFINPQFVCL